jgi:hypothetical protein
MRLAFVMILGASTERPLVFWLAAAWRAARTIELHKTQMRARPGQGRIFRRGSEVHCFHI